MGKKKKQRNEEAAVALPWSDANVSGGDAFEPPPFDEDDASNDEADDRFVEPDDGFVDEEIDLLSTPEGQLVTESKSLIEDHLARICGVSTIRAENGDSGEDVLGVGVSTGNESESPGTSPGLPSLVVYVENEGDQEGVRRQLSDAMGVRAASEDSFPIEVVVTGVIEAYSNNRSKMRPAPAGASVGHPKITAGTAGGWARGRGKRANRLLMVSNNHVLAASNGGKFGDSLIQPGRADGGVSPSDRIAILERFVPIAFGSGRENYVDCATGWCWPTRVRRDHVWHSGSTPQSFKVGSSTRKPRLNQAVGKTGRTTNLTSGRVTATGVSINVNFGAAGVAHFRDQFSVRGFGSKPFSAGGDSGSFVWTWDSSRHVVGLLFAGGGGVTFCNPISRVIEALDVQLI